MRYISIIGLFVLGVFTGQVKAQDSQFSQFYSSPLFLSPSLAGSSDMSRLITNYRSQWANLPHAYSHYALSFDHFLYDYNSGIGALIVRSQDGGVYYSTHMAALYSYHISINRELKVRPGIRAGYFFRNIDYGNIRFADQITRNAAASIEIPKEEHARHYDFSSSVLLYTTKYWLGFTGDHLLALNRQFASNTTYPPLKMTVYGGARLNLFKSVLSKVDRIVTTSFFFKNQAGFHQLDLGVSYEEDPFRVGLYFRGVPTNDEYGGLNAVIVLAGYNFRDFLFNYSYDISTARLLASTGGAHEISLAYQFRLGWGGKVDKMGAVPCPHF